MSNVARVASTAANTLTKPLNVEEVFSTYLYEGTGSAQTITNGIDLAGEGGLVWAKIRSASSTNHMLVDTERGVSKAQRTNFATADQTGTFLSSFNSNGFTLANNFDMNGSGYDIASWTFRKAPKFFDVVTWTGDGTAGRTISHNLNSSVGTIFVKRTDGPDEWKTLHRNDGSQWKTGVLNSTTSFDNATAHLFGNGSSFVAPTSTEFTVTGNLNGNTDTFVAYLFAHNDGDGDFGPTGDQDIIKCGSYTGNGSTDGPEINLGFEPQWVMIKSSSLAENWHIFDNMRGVSTGGDDSVLYPNLSSAESTSSNWLSFTSTGFKITATFDQVNSNTNNYIYIAIRRGPMAVPTDATDVFDTTLDTTNALTTYDIGFPVDMMISSYTGVVTTGNRVINSRLQGFGYVDTDTVKSLYTYGTDSEQSLKTALSWDNNTGFTIPDEYKSGSESVHWSWKRAPSFFDVVAYTGNGTAGRTVSHNLGVAPEMIWVKRRNANSNWSVYHSAIGNDKYIVLNTTNTPVTSSTFWNNTDPTASSYTVGTANGTNNTNDTYIAYLFASLDGISKVGSFTGNGTSKTIDCGFSSGARFVLIKRTDSTGSWVVYDTERGIVSGNDAALLLQSSGAEYSGADEIDPNSSGFDVVHDANGFLTNASGGTYIFYAIA